MSCARLKLKYHCEMTLKDSNPYLRNRSESDRKAALRISAQTSSAVEGIRAPFSGESNRKTPTSPASFIAYWQRRAASTAR